MAREIEPAGHFFQDLGGRYVVPAEMSRKLGAAALFFGNNPLSLAGGAVTTAAGISMIGYWLYELFGHANENPYLGLIFFLILPALFILGLAVIPVGIFLRGGACRSRARSRRFIPQSI